VVPYASSHIAWAESELVLPTHHFCQDDAQTIEELHRILVLQMSSAR
jgi:hypothetical protein